MAWKSEAESVAIRPLVSVIIPHRGPDGALAKCLAAIRNQTLSASRFEVLIALNEEQFRALTFALAPNEVLLHAPRGFSYQARNSGVEHACGEILAFTDSDTVPSPTWLQEGVDALVSHSAELVAGRIDITIAGSRKSAAGLYELLFGFDQERNVRLGVSVTANLFATIAAVSKYGPFDSAAVSGEDFAWVRKAVESGAKLVFAEDASVAHPARQTWSSLLAKSRRTAVAFSLSARGGGVGRDRLLLRAWQQVTAGPSKSRLRGLSCLEVLTAFFVRYSLILFKVGVVLRTSESSSRWRVVLGRLGSRQSN